MSRTTVPLAPTVLVLAALTLACSASNEGPCTVDTQCTPGERCRAGVCVSPDAGRDVASDLASDRGPDPRDAADRPDLVPGACHRDGECDGGVCVTGRCCPSAARACVDRCCPAGAVCFANACLVPGRECRRAGDCDPGQYCEPGLGPQAMMPDGGVDAGLDVPSVDARHDVRTDVRTDATADTGAGDGGPRCFGAAAAPGRCVALPRIETDAGTADGGAGTCEYRPPVGRLDAVRQWTWGPVAQDYPAFTDVWATPTVGRVTDTNCDGTIDADDPPNVVFVSGNAAGSCCSCAVPDSCRTGVLRVLDGRSGREVWSLRQASSTSQGFAGASVVLGDVDGNGTMDIVALTGEGHLAWIDHLGTVRAVSTAMVSTSGTGTFGWGGGLALADMDGDGRPEVAFGGNVFTISGGAIGLRFAVTTGIGGGSNSPLSTFANIDTDPDLELVVGRAAHDPDGRVVWHRTDLPDGFPAVGDLDRDGHPEVVLVAGGRLWVLDGARGTTRLGPFMLPSTGHGGPPTIADFDGDHLPEIGVAQQDFYTVVEPDFAMMRLREVWRTANHDLSSSVTGSTVFDFEGDGIAEVIYNDECFLWVYDGPTGRVRFATPTTSFTATEASLVADVDGDGHAEIVMISNGANPGPSGWHCNQAPWNAPDPMSGRPAWTPPAGATAYRGITLWGDRTDSWVGSRTLWNEHTYHVTNVCDGNDGACMPRLGYGRVPLREVSNWTLGWLNNFRQNVQESGLFNAPDATVSLAVECTAPPVLRAALRNVGTAVLPAGVQVDFFRRTGMTEMRLGSVTSTTALFPGQAVELRLTLPVDADATAEHVVRIVQDPAHPTYRECREDNNTSAVVRGVCIG